MKIKLPHSLLTVIAACFFVSIAPALEVKDKTLTQLEADAMTRYNTAYLQYTSPVNPAMRYYLGDGPCNFTVGEDLSYTGYIYNYPGQKKAENDEWSGDRIVAAPLYGNVFQEFNARIYFTDYGERNIVKGDAERSYSMSFSTNTAEYSSRVTGVTPTVDSAAGGAVYFINAGISDLKELNFVNNALENKLELSSGGSGSAPTVKGGALCILSAEISRIDEVIFTGNSAKSRSRTEGGALYLGYNSLISDIGRLVFTENRAESPVWVMGGAFYAEGGEVRMENVNEIVFSNNTALVNQTGGSVYGGGFSSNEGVGKHYIDSVKHVRFENNVAGLAESLTGDESILLSNLGRLWGGGIYDGGFFYLQNSGVVELMGNRADGTNHAFGALSVEGGAVNAAVFFLTNNESVLFERNCALRHSEATRDRFPALSQYSGVGAFGGAIVSPQVRIYNNVGSVLFKDNYATDRGGAIFQRVINEGGGASYLFADGGDITFIGNTHRLADSNERNSGVANAVWIEPSWKTVENRPAMLLVRARGGRFVNFYDPVCSDTEGNPKPYYHDAGNSYERASIYLGNNMRFDVDGNMVEDYTGTIRFSGEHVRETLAGSEESVDYEQRIAESKVSSLHANVGQYSGTLLLEHGVTFGIRGTGDLDDESNKTGTVFLQYRGILDISGSVEHGETTLAGRNIQFAGTGYEGREEDSENGIPSIPPDPDMVMSILRPGNMARFNADSIDMTTGMTLDLAHHMTATGFTEVNSIQVMAGAFHLGGGLGILDNAVDTNYYYADNRWTQVHKFPLFKDVDGVHDGDFDGVKSLATGSDRVETPYTYSGTWSHEWDGNEMVVVWTPDPPSSGIRDILPELAGGLAMNSMWSSASNSFSTSNAALGNLGASRFKAEPKNNF